MNLVFAFLLGALSAGAWVGYISRVADKTPVQAALFDGAIILPSLLVKQLWALASNDFGVFAAYLGGSMLGTYLGVLWRRRNV